MGLLPSELSVGRGRGPEGGDDSFVCVVRDGDVGNLFLVDVSGKTKFGRH